MFASFCLHYAGVPEDSIPAQAGCIRWTEQLQALGRYAAAGAAAPQPGDLVFFSSSSSSIGHVGIFISGSQFIHSSSGTGSVVISDLDSTYYQTHYVGAKRIIN